MNAEATTIKDKFLDILSPLIDNLIKLGVFYSRELARVILCSHQAILSGTTMR